MSVRHGCSNKVALSQEIKGDNPVYHTQEFDEKPLNGIGEVAQDFLMYVRTDRHTYGSKSICFPQLSISLEAKKVCIGEFFFLQIFTT